MSPNASSNVLVINAGSSSFKYQLLDMSRERRLCQGLAERIGSPDSILKHKRLTPDGEEESFVFERHFANHTEGMKLVAEVLVTADKGGVIQSGADIYAVGHRVLLGGPEYSEALVTAEVKNLIRSYIPLGPLHNPANLAGIEVMEQIFPGLPNVAVFDTGFHAAMPEEAHTYAIPRDLAQKYRIRRYGFHGTSHRYVSREAARVAGIESGAFNAISCHLGNGCSICAVKNGRSVDTSMGLTPLEGLVMGTRSGSLDPAIVSLLMREEGYSPQQVDDLLNKGSGLKGLCGSNDMRDILAARERGDKAADLAFRLFVYSIRKHIGSYYPVLGRVDGIIFTGGIGENSPEVREAVCRDMDALGIAIRGDLNQERSPNGRCISPGGAKTAVYVIPTDEELEIAHAVQRVLAGGKA